MRMHLPWKRMTNTIFCEIFSVQPNIFNIIDVNANLNMNALSRSRVSECGGSSTALNVASRERGSSTHDITVLMDYGSLTYTPMQNRILSLPYNQKPQVVLAQGSPLRSRRRRRFRSIFLLAEHTLCCPSLDQTEARAVKAVHPRVSRDQRQRYFRSASVERLILYSRRVHRNLRLFFRVVRNYLQSFSHSWPSLTFKQKI